RGLIVPAGLRSCISALYDIGLGKRIGLSMAMLTALLLGLGTLATLYADAGKRDLFVGATIFGGVISLGIWAFLHQAIVRPLRSVINGANTLAGGDLSFDFDTSRHDDMGQLQKALQQMSVILRSVLGD